MENAQVQEIQKTSPIRVDKNLSENSLNWTDVYEEDTNLCLDILLYISNTAQKDLFSYSFIDLNDFSKIMNYKKSNLQAYSKKPAYLKSNKSTDVDEIEREDKFITVFENALYKLGRYNIPLNTNFYSPEENKYIKHFKFVQILSDIKILISKKSKKISYYYKTTEEFDYNLSRYFMLVDINDVTKLRKNNMLLLYYYLKKLESQYCEYIEKDIDKIFAYCRMDISDVKKAKQLLKKRKLDIIKNIINFDYDFINTGTGKWNYDIKFIFHDSPSDNKNFQYKALKQATDNYIRQSLIKCYRNKYQRFGRLNSNKFISWVCDTDKDMNLKIEYGCQALSEMNKERLSASEAKGKYMTIFLDKHLKPIVEYYNKSNH